MSTLAALTAIVLALLLAVVLGLALAYVPMRLALGQIARNVTQLIQRQRDRRQATRDSADRRHL